MKGRCLTPTDKRYSYYGGRGIKIYEPWISDFAAFYEHVGNRPTTKHSLDRIDNNGNYEPGNVRWADKQVQSANRRNVLHLEINGERKTLRQWAISMGVDYKNVNGRINRGWEPREALFEGLKYIRH